MHHAFGVPVRDKRREVSTQTTRTCEHMRRGCTHNLRQYASRSEPGGFYPSCIAARRCALALPGVGLVGVISRDRLTGPLRAGIPAASPAPGAPLHEIVLPAVWVSGVPGIANGGMDGPCVPRGRRPYQQSRNNQRSANKSEFHHGLLPPFAVSRVLSSQRPTHSAPARTTRFDSYSNSPLNRLK